MNIIEEIFTSNTETIKWWHMIIRGVITFILTLAMVRAGGKRMFGKQAAFDIVIGIIIGSIVSRAITGNAPFLASMLTTFTLIVLHKYTAKIAFGNKRFEKLVKGYDRCLISNGKIMKNNMKRSAISMDDLIEALRLDSNTTDLNDIKEAYLERSGNISIIKYKDRQ